MWNKYSLQAVIKENFKDHQFIVVSNREPYIHVFKDGVMIAKASIGGVTITLDSIMKATRGTWVAYGGSSADKEASDEKAHVKVPPSSPRYTLRRVWMTEEELDRYYNGFSNSTLWPLCHAVFIRPTFQEADWQGYKKINKRFAQAIHEEINSKKAVVWIQDYQLALLPRYIKEKNPHVLVGHFWHIPWPSQEIFRICPWKKEILDALLHNDLLGFHRYYHMDNFFKTIEREMEARVDREDQTVQYKGKNHKIGIFPVSVDYNDIVNRVEKATSESKRFLRSNITSNYQYLAVGIDRVDYTKGIIQRLKAIELFLQTYPRFKEKFVYLGIGAPSRTSIESYQQLNSEILDLVTKINNRFGQKNWQPIRYINQVIDRDIILHVLSKADLCLVTSLDDGMNLVAKEFVVANKDGALILSHFTGAAKELTEAQLVNPYDIKMLSQSIAESLMMPLKIRTERLNKMKELIRERNLYRWAGKFLVNLAGSK